MAQTKKEKDEKFIQYWENSMQLGRVLYSLINAFLIAGILFALTNLGYYLFTQEFFLGWNWDTLLSLLVCYGIGFLLFYIPVWNINSYKYNVVLKKKKKGKKK